MTFCYGLLGYEQKSIIFLYYVAKENKNSPVLINQRKKLHSFKI